MGAHSGDCSYPIKKILCARLTEAHAILRSTTFLTTKYKMAHGGLLLGIVISGVRILEDQSPVSSAVETCMAGPSFLLLVVYI